MSPGPTRVDARPAASATADRIAASLGDRIREERRRRQWTLRELADRAGVALGTVQGIEAGTRGSLEMYARLCHALSLRLDADAMDPRRNAQRAPRDVDVVHAAMGEIEADHLRSLGFQVAIDEPYQHYQFAGRADVVAWSVADSALLHIENRTGFPNLQEAAGSYNAKRAYLAPAIAERIGLRGGFGCEAHVIAALWSAEVLHTVRLRRASFRSLCPDPPFEFEAWWRGARAEPRRTSAFILFDPLAAGRERRWVDLETAIASARPRVRGYADAAARLSGHV